MSSTHEISVIPSAQAVVSEVVAPVKTERVDGRKGVGRGPLHTRIFPDLFSGMSPATVATKHSLTYVQVGHVIQRARTNGLLPIPTKEQANLAKSRAKRETPVLDQLLPDLSLKLPTREIMVRHGMTYKQVESVRGRAYAKGLIQRLTAEELAAEKRARMIGNGPVFQKIFPHLKNGIPVEDIMRTEDVTRKQVHNVAFQARRNGLWIHQDEEVNIATPSNNGLSEESQLGLSGLAIKFSEIFNGLPASIESLKRIYALRKRSLPESEEAQKVLASFLLAREYVLRGDRSLLIRYADVVLACKDELLDFLGPEQAFVTETTSSGDAKLSATHARRRVEMESNETNQDFIRGMRIG